jgi:hypothetical protein
VIFQQQQQCVRFGCLFLHHKTKTVIFFRKNPLKQPPPPPCSSDTPTLGLHKTSTYGPYPFEPIECCFAVDFNANKHMNEAVGPEQSSPVSQCYFILQVRVVKPYKFTINWIFPISRRALLN